MDLYSLSSCCLARSCTSCTSLSLWLTEDSDMAEVVDSLSSSSSSGSCELSRDTREDPTPSQLQHIYLINYSYHVIFFNTPFKKLFV